MSERKEQGLLNFTLAQKSFILREAVHYLPHFRMVRVLRVIDDLHFMTARDKNFVTLTHTDIAQSGGMSVPTVRRAIDDLINHDYLIKQEIVTSYGQAANSYKIAWSMLDARIIDGEAIEVCDSESTQVVKEAGDHFDQGGDHDKSSETEESTQVVKVAGDHFDQGGDQKDQASLSLSININPPPPLQKPTWEEVEFILFSEMKVGLAVEAIEAAQGRGCTAEDILELIEHVRSKPGAYGPGAIYTRVKQAVPGTDPAFGWPNETKAYQTRKTIQHVETQRVREKNEREEKRQQFRRYQEMLENNYGRLLDAMDLSEIRFIADQCPKVITGAIRRDPEAARQSGGLYRIEILKALHARQAECLDHLNSAVAEESAIADQR